MNLKESDKLLKDLRSKLKEVMMSINFGYSESEVEEYSSVAIKGCRVTVRAEVSYSRLGEIMEALNPIIQKLDKNSYFDPERPGILIAVVGS